MKEEEIRQKVKELKGFYVNALCFLFGNALFVLIWLAFDRSGGFWHKYIFLVWGTALVVDAYRKGILDLFSFMTPEWEEEKINKIIGPRHDQRRIRLQRDGKK